MDYGGDAPKGAVHARASDSERVIVLVLGMHRSGTSALSGVVHMLGARAPATLQPGNRFNEKGYWESQPIVRLNNRLLEAAASAWNDCAAFREENLASGTRSEFEAELADLMAVEFGDARLMVLKDPRICRLASFWLRALDRATIAPKIAIPIRNPLECAFSLLGRDGIPIQDGLSLWLRHVLDAERHTRGRSRCFVSYPDLLDDWRTTADRLAAALQIEWPISPSDAASKIDGFLNRDLRHHRTTSLKVGKTVADLAAAAHQALTTLAAAPSTESLLDDLNEIHDAFEQASRISESSRRWRMG
jgi:hypothetical protein